MKNQLSSVKRIFGLFACIALNFSFVLHASELSTEIRLNDKDITIMAGDNLVGGWEYTAQGAPEGYDKGFLLIVGQNGRYQVQVQNGAGTFIGENVSVKKNTISFTLMIEGEQVTVNLTAEGSKISGKSSSSEGDYTIEGVKSISPE